jgi:hypothetical protein
MDNKFEKMLEREKLFASFARDPMGIWCAIQPADYVNDEGESVHVDEGHILDKNDFDDEKLIEELDRRYAVNKRLNSHENFMPDRLMSGFFQNPEKNRTS